MPTLSLPIEENASPTKQLLTSEKTESALARVGFRALACSSEDGSSPGSVWPPGLSYMTTDVARDT